MKITKLTHLAFYLNGASGSGKYSLTVAEVKKHVRDGSIFQWLESTLGTDVDPSVLDDAEQNELLKEWQDLADAVNEGRKYAVEPAGGLSLLVAYLLEGIQRRAKH